VAGAKVSRSELCSDGEALYWLESRPDEAGRVVVVRCAEGRTADHSPATTSIRSRVHEYGGGALCLLPGQGRGAFAYVDQADQRVWCCDGAAGPDASEPAAARALSPVPADGETHRHGGLTPTPDGAWVLAVREVHRDGATRPERSVVAYPTTGASTACVLVEGHDFFGAPRVDPSGTRLAVVVWDHPDMPWDASTLVVVPLGYRDDREGAASELAATGPAMTLAGGPGESVGQPGWARDGTVRFVSDRRGWWQPYRRDAGAAAEGGTEAWSDDRAEFHGPDWVLGLSTMAELPDGRLVARRTADGRDELVVLDAPGGRGGERLAQPCVAIAAVCAHRDGVAFIGATPESPPAVWSWSPGDGAHLVSAPPASGLRNADVSVAEPFVLTGRSGRAVHGTLYRPGLSHTQGPADAPPPLVTWCHGGPTSASQGGLDLTVQFFTTRGFAVACVDYAGSSGYGREYRCSLWGQWGVADSEDCLDAALHLAARGDVDGARMVVRGSSAGGMTALNALASGEGFAAGVSWYGVTDLLALAASTHDFEAQYTDRLIGPLPDATALYEERSPTSRAGSVRGAALLMQGTEDAVVPPEQAERMRAALEAAGARCTLRFLEGEGHGFRRADTIAACLEDELAFYLAELHL
jgi:dipeptidyl aminopeptidase/acylaminoacyl peptidase